MPPDYYLITRFDLNSIFLLHSVLYRNYTEVISSSESPLHAVLMDLGNMPDQVTTRLERGFYL